MKISDMIKYLSNIQKKYWEINIFVNHRCSVWTDVFTNHTEFGDITYINISWDEPITFETYIRCEERFGNKI